MARPLCARGDTRSAKRRGVVESPLLNEYAPEVPIDRVVLEARSTSEISYFRPTELKFGNWTVTSAFFRLVSTWNGMTVWPSAADRVSAGRSAFAGSSKRTET